MKFKNPFIKRDIFWIAIIIVLIFCVYVSVMMIYDTSKTSIAYELDNKIYTLKFQEVNKSEAWLKFNAYTIRFDISMVGEQGSLRGERDLAYLCKSRNLSEDNSTKEIAYLVQKYVATENDCNLTKEATIKEKKLNENFAKGLQILNKECKNESKYTISDIFWFIYFLSRNF